MRKYSLLISVLIMLTIVSCATSGTSSVEQPVAQEPVAETLKSGGMAEVLMSDPASLSLYKTYEKYGMMIGTDLNAMYINDSWCSKTLDRQFNIFVPSYELKPNKILDQKRSQENGKLAIVLSDEIIQCM